MAERPYHHGNLRAALLVEAERTLREQGIEQLSLRDLARQIGVSHAAPRRHFADRQALLDALATTGFTRLVDEIHAALAAGGEGTAENYEARLQAVATAYVRFAVHDAALLDLMFAAKNAEPSTALRDASARLFATVGDLLHQGQQAGKLQSGDLDSLRLLLIATFQGIAALVTSGRVQAWQTGGLIADAVALFTRRQP